jgi:hypothetical protein
MFSHAHILFAVYCALTGAIFVFFPQQPISQLFPALPPGSEPFRVATVYAEIIGVLNVVLCLIQYPEGRSFFLSAAASVGIIAKHIMLDRVLPPMPVVGLSGICFLASLYGMMSRRLAYGQKTLSALHAITAATYLMSSGTVVQQMFPDVKSGSASLGVGVVLCQTVGAHAVAVVFALSHGNVGRALASSTILGGSAYHYFVLGIVPPSTVWAFQTALAALCMYTLLFSPAEAGVGAAIGSSLTVKEAKAIAEREAKAAARAKIAKNGAASSPEKVAGKNGRGSAKKRKKKSKRV